MTLYVIGGERDSYSESGTITESNSVGLFDSAYSRNSVKTTAGSFIDVDPGVTLTEYWVHWGGLNDVAFATTPSVLMILKDSGGTDMFRFLYTASNTLQTQYWNGSAWTNIGSTWAYGNAFNNWDLLVVPGASGRFELYKNQVLFLSASASMTAFSSLQVCRLNGPASGSANFNWSQIKIQSTSTVNSRVYTSAPTSNGTDAGGTGTFSDVSEILLSDTTYWEFGTAGDKRSTKAAARTLSRSCKGVGISFRAMRVDATGPQQIRPYLIIGGTRYYGSTFPLTTGFLGYRYLWTLNPSTGAAWTTSQANDANMEMGLEAVA